MNTFTKLALSFALLGITQQVFPQEMMYKTRQKVDIPFYDGNTVRSHFLKQQTVSDTLWLPGSVIESDIDQDDNIFPMLNDIYEYDENGLLKKASYYRLSDGYLMCVYFCNNTYIDPLMDIPDTILYNSYTDGNGINRPAVRYYYNNRQADSSYWEEYFRMGRE